MTDPVYNPEQPSNFYTSGTTKTTRYFNNFFTPSFTVSQNTNDAIVSFFQQQTDNLDSAKLLAQAVIDTAQAQREDPMAVLSEFQNLPNGQLNAVLTLYLNTSRVNTSLLALKTTPRSNLYVSRTILA